MRITLYLHISSYEYQALTLCLNLKNLQKHFLKKI